MAGPEAEWPTPDDGFSTVTAVHKMIVPAPVPWSHLPINDLDPDTLIVCSGDYHQGWPDPLFVNGTWWCNPGALARTFSSQGDFERPVRCAMVDTDYLAKEHLCPIKYIDLPASVVRSPEDCYDAESKSSEEDRAHLIVSVSDAIKRVQGVGAGGWEVQVDRLRTELAARTVDPSSLADWGLFDGLTVEQAIDALVDQCNKQAEGT